MNYLEMLFGRVTGVYRVTAGHPLTAAAPVGSVVLQVADTADFDETGGQVLIGSLVYDYTEVDPEANTLTLATALTVAAAADDQVEVFDPRVGGTTVVGYEADVVLDDQDVTDRPIQVDVPHGLVQMLEESTRGGAAEAVTLVRDGEYDWSIWQINGKLAVDIALEEVKADLGGGLQDAYDRADEAAAAAAEAAATGTAAMTTANGKNKVTYSASAPGTTPNNPGDIWYVRSGSTITAQYEGLGGTSWASRTLTNVVVTSLDAGALTAGSAFTNALSVKTNFTLGDATTDGVIQSYNFANSSVGVFIDKNGMVAKGGSLAGAAVTGGTITGSTFQTSTGNSGVRINSDGTFTAYNADGSVGLSLSAGFLTLHRPLSVSDVYSTGEVTFMAGLDGYGGLNIRTGTAYLQATQIAGALTGVSATFTGEVHGNGVVADDLDAGAGGTVTPAQIGARGRLQRGSSSSRTVKKNIKDLEIDLAAVLKIRPVTFQYRDEENYGTARRPGVIAEELVEAGLSEFVIFDRDENPVAVHYPELVTAVIPLLRDLTARIEQLESR